MIKKKLFLLPENLDQLSNLKICFVSAMLVFIDIAAFLNLFLIAAIVFHYLELIQSQLQHKLLYQLL